uniref:Uncharacterized protein n=1 Tax=Rhizophora mucronata TaxID=61149 RepID=A0A2P2LXR3_RHIMU
MLKSPFWLLFESRFERHLIAYVCRVVVVLVSRL